MPVRALLRMVTVDTITVPYNAIQLKIFYPALEATTDEHRKTGVLPFDTNYDPAPVVVFLPGVNCSAHTYEWLAIELAKQGIVMVIANWIAENLPKRFSISPGIDIEAVQKSNYGIRPTSSSLPAILNAVEALYEDDVLAGNLRDGVIFGGHSAGGTMALQNARHDWFPDVVGAFSFCSYPMATAVLGKWDTGEIPPMPVDVPVLMMGATEDGIGDHHIEIFTGIEETGAENLARLFTETGYRNSILCIFDGANHHTICHPADTTIGRIFMDYPATSDEDAIRQQIAKLVSDFIHSIGANVTIQCPTTAAIWLESNKVKEV